MRRILDLLAALAQAEVDYVVVGGVAVVLRGHARMTVDRDLALDLAAENVRAVLAVLERAGLVPRPHGHNTHPLRRTPRLLGRLER